MNTTVIAVFLFQLSSSTVKSAVLLGHQKCVQTSVCGLAKTISMIALLILSPIIQALLYPPIRRETGLASLKVSYRDASVAAAGRSQGGTLWWLLWRPFGGSSRMFFLLLSQETTVHFSRDFLFHLKGGRDLISEPIVNLV